MIDNMQIMVLGLLVSGAALVALIRWLGAQAPAEGGGGGSLPSLDPKVMTWGILGIMVAITTAGIVYLLPTLTGGGAGVQTQSTAYPFWLLATSMLGVVGIIAAFVWIWRTSSKDQLVSRLLTTSLIIAVAVLGLWGLSQISWKGVENITFPAIEDEAGNVVFFDQTFDWATAWLWEKRFQLLALAVMAVFLYGSWSHFLNGSGSGARLLVSTTVAIAFVGLGLYMVAQGLLGENGAKALQEKLSAQAVAAVESMGPQESDDEKRGTEDAVPPVPDAKADERRGAVETETMQTSFARHFIAKEGVVQTHIADAPFTVASPVAVPCVNPGAPLSINNERLKRIEVRPAYRGQPFSYWAVDPGEGCLPIPSARS